MGERVHAISLYTQAQQIKDGNNPHNMPMDHAYRLIASSVMADPTIGLGWYEYGNANSDNMWRHAAVAAYRRALELPDGSVTGDMNTEFREKCMVNLAHNLHHLGCNKEAKDIVRQALARNNDLNNGWITLSLIENVEGRLKDAQKSARKAMELGRTPNIELGLAFALMYDRKLADGLRHFEARFEYILRNFLNYPYPQWKGEPGKTVFLVSEQGMGDALSFSRFVPALIERSKFVHIRVNSELLKLFRIMFQKYDNISIEPMPCPYAAADCWTTYMSLPVALGMTDKEIIEAPALPCPSLTIDQSWKSTDRTLHIGVSWTGSQANWINHYRSFPIELLLELYRVPGVQLYSLQADDASQQIHDKGMASLIRDMKPYVRDVCDTLAILKDLDLVVTCESALGHIAGLMGKECIIPYSYNGGDFRIGRTEEGSIWYPNHRIFKQGYDMDWRPVFGRIVRHLQRRQKGTQREDHRIQRHP
jgi:tetratricopeptide (TPR) repeat protein